MKRRCMHYIFACGIEWGLTIVILVSFVGSHGGGGDGGHGVGGRCRIVSLLHLMRRRAQA